MGKAELMWRACEERRAATGGKCADYECYFLGWCEHVYRAVEAAGKGPSEGDDDGEAGVWFMAERVDDCGTGPAESVRQSDLPETDCGQIADMSENAPDCARDDASASEDGASDGEDGPNDAREKLESLVRDLREAVRAE